MTIIRFSNLQMAEAEEVIAEIWNCLEEYDMPTPEMQFSFGPTTVSMRVKTREPRWDFAIALRLASLGGTVVQPRCAGRARGQQSSYRSHWVAASSHTEPHGTRARS